MVTDLGSTNGTVLVQPGLGPEDLTPGVAVQLIPGALIDLGDGVTIQVSQPLTAMTDADLQPSDAPRR